jgi:hypothetical protein
MADPTKPIRNPTKPSTVAVGGSIINARHPMASVAEGVARAHAQADKELSDRMHMNVHGEAGDPLAAKIDSIIPQRVTRSGVHYDNPNAKNKRQF